MYPKVKSGLHLEPEAQLSDNHFHKGLLCNGKYADPGKENGTHGCHFYAINTFIYSRTIVW